MNEPLFAVGAILVWAVGYVVVPNVLDAASRYRGARAVRCPRAEKDVSVAVDPWRAGVSSLVSSRVRLRVVECSEWPARAGCDQNCMAPAAG
ncbi:MAG: hypothetical protein IT379_38490 [Deltaproteobacteria bacterium]|nr:hypothetical protein [Deltaproteobacteria bacterium]